MRGKWKEVSESVKTSSLLCSADKKGVEEVEENQEDNPEACEEDYYDQIIEAIEKCVKTKKHCRCRPLRAKGEGYSH